jgi:phenylacetate-CoA ligase
MSTQIILRVLALRHRLRQRDRWTRRRLEEHQGQALRLLREHAYDRSPFYGRWMVVRRHYPCVLPTPRLR